MYNKCILILYIYYVILFYKDGLGTRDPNLALNKAIN